MSSYNNRVTKEEAQLREALVEIESALDMGYITAINSQFEGLKARIQHVMESFRKAHPLEDEKKFDWTLV